MKYLDKLAKLAKTLFYRLTEVSIALVVLGYFILSRPYQIVPEKYVEPTKNALYWLLLLGIGRFLKVLPKNREILNFAVRLARNKAKKEIESNANLSPDSEDEQVQS